VTQRSDSNEGLVKVVFDVPEKDGSILKTESLWAEPVGEDRYRLRNVPVLVFGFSEQDVITATDNNGKLVVTGVATRGGHSTYRLVLPEDTIEEKFLQDFDSRNSAALTDAPHDTTSPLMCRLMLTSMRCTKLLKRESERLHRSSRRVTVDTCNPNPICTECQLARAGLIATLRLLFARQANGERRLGLRRADPAIT